MLLMGNTKLSLLYFLLYVTFIKCQNVNECKTDLDCNKPSEYIRCAYCLESKCKIIDQEIFKTSLPCQYAKNHCVKDYCNNTSWGPLEGYGECLCMCHESYYGKRCQHKVNTKTNFPNAFLFFPPTHLEYNQPAPFIINMGQGPWSPWSLPNVSYIVQDTHGGYLARINIPENIDVNEVNEFCQYYVQHEKYTDKFVCEFFGDTARYNILYRSRLLYTSRFVIPFDWTSPPGEKATSSIRQMQLDVYWDHMKLSEHVHHYHVYYPKNYESIPTIRFTGCGHTLTSIRKYEYKDQIQLTAEILYVKNFRRIPHYLLQEREMLTFLWEAYKIEGDTSKSAMSNDIHIGRLIWDLPAFHWLGKYVINFTVTGYFHNWGYYMTEKRKGSNFNICTVEVKYSPLVAVISGGSSRFIYKEHGFVLDASDSKDPNSPEGNTKLQFTFTCNWTHEDVCQPYTTNSLSYEPYQIIPKKLISEKTYNFTLKVTVEGDIYMMKPSYASQMIFVGELGKAKAFLKYISIECVYNCGVKTNPKDILYLRVKGAWTLLTSLKFVWAKYELDINGIKITEDTSVDNLKQNNTPSFILIINENSLKENLTYDFKVNYINSPQFAVYSIVTACSASITCQIVPDSGVAGLTKFSLTCTISSPSIVFEFYDKHESDGPGFTGRMIASQESGNLEDLVLTRGQLEIVSFDDFGMASQTTLNVKLSKGNHTTASVKQFISNLMKLSHDQSVRDSLKMSSTIADLLNSALQDIEINKNDLFELLIKVISTLQVRRYDNVKLGISTLHIILLATRESLTLDGTKIAAYTIYTLLQALAVNLKNGHHCTFHDLYQILRQTLDCLHIVIELKYKYSGNETLPLKYINPVIYSRVKESSQYIIKSFIFLKSILSLRHLPAQKHKLIESRVGNLSIWIKVDIPSELSKFTQKNHHENKFPVIVPITLAEEIKRMGFYLTLLVISNCQDPIWISRSNTKKIFDVSVCYKGNKDQSCHYPIMLKYGIKVAFSTSLLTEDIHFINVTLRRLEPYIESDIDMKLAVYKLDPCPQATVDAYFRFHSNDTELLVLAMKDMRPTYSFLTKEGFNLTSNNAVYKVVSEPSDKNHLYYIAVHPLAVAKLNETVHFQMKIISKMCYTWHYQWETRGCQSKTEPNTGDLICECNRLSLIGGLVKEIPFPLQAVMDFPMSPTASDTVGAKVPGFLLFFFVFLLLFIISIKADRHDSSKRFVSILPDNIPGDTFGYLICVVTGARLGAGTDAVVGIKMYGARNDGRRHILTNKAHDVMEGFGEDWFLMYEPESLGKITCLDLWHDSAGAKANWFCDSIIIYDLHHKDCYFFIVNEWITLSLKRFPQVCLFPTPFSEITSMSRVFLDYFKSGFRLSHLWLDAIVRHPRDPVSRVDRIAIIMCFILASMATSITLITLYGNYLYVDDFSYSITWLMVEMSVYTCVPSAVISCLLMYMFRRNYKVIFFIEKHEEKLTHERIVTRVSLQEDYLTSPSSTSLRGDDKSHIHYGHRHKHLLNAQQNRTLAEIINLNLMPKPLVPVQLAGDVPNVIIRVGWLLATWISVVGIIFLCVIACIFLSRNLYPIQTKKWLTSVGLSVFIHAVILLPTKITFVSLFLAVTFKRIIYKDAYTFDSRDGRQLKLFGNIKYLANLVHLRAQAMYKPLHEVFREKHRLKMIRAAQLRRFYQFVVQVMFLIVLGSLLSTEIPTKQQSNTHLRTLIKDFYNVHNTSQYLNYLQNRYGLYLFEYIWYNWKQLNIGSELKYFRKDWISDKVNRMVGKVRLRQFRVKPGYCKISINLTTDCAAPFSTKAQDTQHYFAFWISPDSNTQQDETMDFKFLRNWSYKWSSDDSSLIYDGKTGHSYPTGGYTWDLGVDNEEFDASLVRLREDGWIDHYTRAVIAQVKMYNINTCLFSEVTLLSEHTIAGEVLTTVVVNSVNVNFSLDWWIVIFVFFTFMMCVRIFVLINFVGVLRFFKNWRRPYELIMALNAIAVLLYMFLHWFIAPTYISQYQLHSNELMLFDFYKIAHFCFTARTLLCALYILNLIRVYSLWRFGKAALRLFLTIILSIEYVVWLTAVFIAFQLFLFKTLKYLSFMFTDVFFNPNMFYRNNYSYFSDGKAIPGLSVLNFVMCFSAVIIYMLFVSVFTYEYKITKRKLITWTTTNYFTFIYEEITSVITKKLAFQN